MRSTDHGVTIDLERHANDLDAVLGGDLDDQRPQTVASVVDRLRRAGATRLISDHPPNALRPLPLAIAQALAVGPARTIWQLRAPLPVAPDHPERTSAPTIEARPFDGPRDVDAWVRSNNRAFAHHPDQGTQTAASLEATLAEPWVDLDGFLVVDDPDRPGELAGSCWTRVHPADEGQPAFGEIFVIGVDPSHHGIRLGAALALAGLDHLSQRGLDTAMLYVDDDNAPARRLYERLGFAPHHRRLVHTLGGGR